MITAIEIENFKGIRDRVRIELKPITLLFGPNSSGKSTIFHALNYAREVLLERALDLDHIRGEQDGQRLGGFRNFVHNHNLERKVVLRFEFKFHPGLVFAEFFERSDDIDDKLNHPLMDFSPDRGWVEVEIKWHQLSSAPFVAAYRACMLSDAGQRDPQEDDVEEEGFEVQISSNPDRRSVTMDRIDHLYRERGESHLESQPLWVSPWSDYEVAIPKTFELAGQADALPDPAKPLSGSDDQRPVRAILSKLALAPYHCLRLYLRGFKSLAAWRETPPRPMMCSTFPLRPSWTGGLAAWSELLTCEQKFIDQVNACLTKTDRLNLGYALLRRTTTNLEHSSPIWHELINGRAFDSIEDLRGILHELPTETRLVVVDQIRQVELHPQDVGMGLLHVVPVVVASLRKRNGYCPELWGFDEPELHTHPRVQAAMGDLFIEATRPGQSWPDQKAILIASHSEHLLLRLLRRIREAGACKAPPGLKATGNDVGVCYVSTDVDRTTCRNIAIDRKGEFVQPWPDDFFELDFYERFGNAG